MHITADRMMQLAPALLHGSAVFLADSIDRALPMYSADAFPNRAHFMAQACHESAGFTRFEENFHYTSPARLDAMFAAVHGVQDAAELIQRGPEAIANRVYADRMGNGNEASGDGWRFRGRGIFQLTGRSNYRAAGDALGVDLTDWPDNLLQPRGAVLSALWFWKWRGCNIAAARDDVEGVTRLINGAAMDGLEQRRALTQRAKEIFRDGAEG